MKLFNDRNKYWYYFKDKYDTVIEQIHISESNDKRIIEVGINSQEYYKGCQTIFLSLMYMQELLHF